MTYTEQHYRNTLDGLEAHHISGLIDIAEGDAYRLLATNPYVVNALAKAGLTYTHDDIVWYCIVRGDETVESYEALTDYGLAFVRWYMQPRETAQQLALF